MADMTMVSVIEVLNLSNEYPVRKRADNFLCPICSSKKKKLNINFDKNVFRCNKCGWSGGPLEFFKVHAKIYDDRQAGIEFNKLAKKDGQLFSKPRIAPTQEPIASSKELHLAYSYFLDKCSLYEEHVQNLRLRGLSAERIKANGYRSMPCAAVKRICHELLLEGICLEGIPGFYKEDGEWNFVRYGSGFLIPSRDVNGNIIALQIRKDSSKCSRYLTISSDGKDSGCKGKAFPHFSKGCDFEKVILTEGALKADIITALSGYSAIGVLGVNSLSHLPKMLNELKALGLSRVLIAYDMDMYENSHVAKALVSLKTMLSSSGLSYSQLFWDRNYKGLDDYLASKYR